eukprot:CAMPEP_0114543130 /NCGR_PEP_ID=MMETSP0114-20121206/2195_1 /TAXON_ID=31324 /ORGANISM="Goniomonas sp, Strain m" /LENGTH=594 /DNA_ID=CAMNT_0001727455 /DNA_START=6 /DNA_END=1787 /DNA_ORIENTATION=+
MGAPELSQGPLYAVEPSLNNVKTWPEKRAGYLSLCFFLSFVVLYLVIVSMQLKIGASYSIGSGLETVFNNDGALAGVYTQAQFWDYLLQDGSGLMNILFTNQWYNGQAFTTNEQGFLLHYDKLVGGLLVVQQRGGLETDGCVGLYGDSAYDKFYADCYLDARIKEDRAVSVPADIAPWYKYDEGYAGYAAFFGVAAGSATNLALAQKLKDNLWTDKQTRMLQIKFALYNGNLNAFSFVKISFIFDKAGIFVNGNKIVYQSISMEPYRTESDKARLGLEIVFLVWLSFQLFHFLFESVSTARKEGVRALVSMWTLVDAGNLSLFVLFVVLRVRILFMIYDNPIQVPTNVYQEILEDVADVQDVQRLVVFLTIFLSLLRLFKFYQFQDRLNVLNRTFANAFTDLYHFLIMFCIIFGGFAIMSHFLFGLSLSPYASLGLSLMSMWQWFCGSTDQNDLIYISPTMGTIFYILYQFVGILILQNVLLAILIDAYAKAVADLDAVASVADEMGIAVQKMVRVLRCSKLNDAMMCAALEKLHAKGIESVSATELKSAAGVGVDVADYPGVVPFDDTGEEKPEENNSDLMAALDSVLKENAW